MSKKKTSKKTNGKSFGVRAACVVLAVAVVAAGVCCTGFVSRDADGKWFGNGDIKTWHWSDKAPDDKQEETEIPVFAGGMYITGTEGDGFDLLSAQIPVEAYAENGLVGYADNAYTITATVKPDNYATNTGVEWELTWKDPESEWATGKSVTDYVTATPSGAGYMESKIVSLTCAQAFGERIILTARAKEKPEVSAVATLDYVQRLEAKNVGLKFGDITCDFEGKKNPMFPNVSQPGTQNTKVPLQLSAYGTAAGGMPELVITQPDEPYTIAGDYQYSYRLNRADGESSYFCHLSSMGSTYYYLFPNYESENEIFPADVMGLNEYNIAEKGLYFGLKNFIEDLELCEYYAGRNVPNGEITKLTLSQIEACAARITDWWANKNDDTSGYTTANYLFGLTLTVSSEYSNFTRSTKFTIGSIVNTTNSIDDIELNPPSTTI